MLWRPVTLSLKHDVEEDRERMAYYLSPPHLAFPDLSRFFAATG
jgi:hypothetical protein